MALEFSEEGKRSDASARLSSLHIEKRNTKA
jgi:hypothetical protein